LDLLVNGLRQSFSLIAHDAEIWQILLTTLKVTGTATIIALFLGMPIGVVLGLTNFRGRKILLSFVNTGMGLPPVVVGLFVSLMFWRSGVFGFLDIMYTPLAIIIAELIIAFPVVVGLTFAAIQNLEPRLGEQILSLGANRLQYLFTILKEARIATLAAIIAGFGAIISEVGAAAMVGGNIRWQTRLLTTAILLETQAGQFDKAIALSFLLLTLALFINFAFTRYQQKGAKGWTRLYR